MIILICTGLIVSWWRRTLLTYSENRSPFSETLDLFDTYCKHLSIYREVVNVPGMRNVSRESKGIETLKVRRRRIYLGIPTCSSEEQGMPSSLGWTYTAWSPFEKRHRGELWTYMSNGFTLCHLWGGKTLAFFLGSFGASPMVIGPALLQRSISMLKWLKILVESWVEC